MEPIDSQIRNYLDHLANSRNASENTLISYRSDLEKLGKYLETQKINDFRGVNETTLNAYILKLEKEGYASSTIARCIASIKNMYEYMLRYEGFREDPSVKLKPPKVQNRIPEILTIEQVTKLLEQPGDRTPKEIRDKAMLELLYATGIRVSELIAVTLDDINLGSGYVRMTQHGKARIIPLGSKARVALGKYIRQTRTLMLKDPDEKVLFVNCNGRPMTRQGFWKILKGYAEMAGLQDVITPHTLRHSFAAHLLENGADIRSVQEMLGNNDISSTEIYFRMNPSRIRDIYLNSHPRA